MEEQSKGAGEAVPAVPVDFSISATAAARLAKMLEEWDPTHFHPKPGLKIGVRGGGCSGLTYTMEMVPEPAPKDRVFEQDGTRVYIDFKSLVFLKRSVLVWSDGLQSAGFKIENPKAKAQCGCGESFSV